MAQPDGLIEDVVVAGVSESHTLDENNPRAWVVTSQAGKRKGDSATIKALEELRMVSAKLGETEAVKRRVRGRHRGMRCLIFVRWT